MSQSKIAVVYRRTADRHVGLGFAADLAKRLGTGSLIIYLNQALELANLVACDPQSADTCQKDRVMKDVAAVTGFQGKIELARSFAPGMLVVDRKIGLTRDDLNVLSPARETGLLARGKGPILIPFGDGQSAVYAARVALGIARALGLPVIFYHTTWRIENLDSDNALDHVCGNARMVKDQLTALASEFRVAHSFVIETAADVTEGILHAAMREGAKLVVIPRSKKTTVGCYAERALKESPLPILALAAQTGRSL